MSDEVRFVRLRPVNVQTGHTCQVFTMRFGGRFYKFSQPGVWHRVPLALAERLALARQVATRPGSPPIFDVMTEQDARAVDWAEKVKREQEQAVVEPTVDTAQDMTGPGRGDLTLEETVAGRAKALEEATARALGADDDHPSRTFAPRPISADEAPEPSASEPQPEPNPLAPSRRTGAKKATTARKSRKSSAKRKAKAPTDGK